MRLASSIAFMWLIRIATLTSSALLSIVTARALGPGGRGAFVLPAIDASVAVTFAAGLSSATSYYMLNRKAGSQIVRALVVALVIFAALGSGATVVTALISHSAWAIGPALAYMCFYAGYSAVCGYYFGRDRARTAGMVNASLSLSTLAFVACAVWRTRSPSTALLAWIFAIGCVAVVGALFVLADSRKLEGEGVGFAAFARFGAKTGLLNVANLLNYRVDIFIVAMLLPIATVGLYTIAVTAAESLLSVTLAVGQATLPRIGSLDRTEGALFAARCLRNTVFFATILCGIGLVSAPVLIGLTLGQAYASVVAPLRILLVGIIAASTASLVSSYFVMNVGRTNAPLAISLISTVICAVISFALIPGMGMVGAAIASTVAYAISQTIAIVYFCRVSGVAATKVLILDRRDFALFGRIVRRAVRIT